MRDSKPDGSLVSIFLERYNDFRSQLKRRLGSEDLAHDAMQEAFLKVNDLPASSSIQQPAAYLFRVALNIAEDQRRRDSRLLTGVEISELINMTDEAADPARIAQGRSQIDAFRRALRGLPERTQQMVLAARVHELPHAEIARRYGVSERIVSKELKRALEHCARELDASGGANAAPRHSGRHASNQDEGPWR
ncbi:putative RNA polymerase sigma factor FecI [compost metagenome]|uniref:RNA polymerase sigma factor n=1 Tax=Achromobacter sp. Root83 TaxID=1736602 RepID=UPI0007099E6E|nr:RNA polymerase sigma factor [Achromobacter sp. Root83]KRC70128.1 RNA polymerase subunit sigma [Achromobacter sp. Root83]